MGGEKTIYFMEPCSGEHELKERGIVKDEDAAATPRRFFGLPLGAKKFGAAIFLGITPAFKLRPAPRLKNARSTTKPFVWSDRLRVYGRSLGGDLPVASANGFARRRAAAGRTFPPGHPLSEEL
jgi:hypothetical protein